MILIIKGLKQIASLQFILPDFQCKNKRKYEIDTL